MILLTAEHLNKSYSEKPLIEDISFGINEGDKIGVIGINGTGKSTLLKLIAGIEKPDSGSIIKGNGVRIGYLPQNPEFQPGKTVLQQAMLHARSESEEFECKNLLTRLGITDFDAPVETLSGGQRKRVAMAAVFSTQSELLILDEPTNHIDGDTVQWLEEYLARYQGALLMVTHDRYFLDRVTNKIAELTLGSIYMYEGGYSKFLELKAQREEMELATERKRQSLLRKELEWIKRGARARSTKARFRVERFEEMSSRPKLAVEEQMESGTVENSFFMSRLGKKTIELSNVSKGYGDRLLFDGLDYILARDDRLGIVGPNGSGKSTLLKLLAGEHAPTNGGISFGETVKVGYFSQECEDMDLSQRVIDYIKDRANIIETPDGTLTASQMLEKFLFPSALQYTTIGRLSGGERRRLYLLRVLMDAPNVLLLDEPTNDLDIQTLSILEDYLDSFPGAVVAVSHDRYFLDRVADHLFVFEDGVLSRRIGGYSEYLQERRTILRQKEKAAKAPKTESAQPNRSAPAPKLKFTFKEQKEYETIDEVIASLEQKIADTEEEIGRTVSDFIRLQELTEQKEDLETQLAEKMERWVYLTELAEKIEAQNKR